MNTNLIDIVKFETQDSTNIFLPNILKNIKNMIIKNSRITIPKYLNSLLELEVIASNIEFPKSMYNLKNLKLIYIRNINIGHLPNLKILYFSNCENLRVSDKICSNLVELYSFSNIPFYLPVKMPNLKFLACEYKIYNKIFPYCPKLKELYFDDDYETNHINLNYEILNRYNVYYTSKNGELPVELVKELKKYLYFGRKKSIKKKYF